MTTPRGLTPIARRYRVTPAIVLRFVCRSRAPRRAARRLAALCVAAFDDALAAAAGAGGLATYAVACAALAWAAAAGWDDRVFRIYYLCGGLLSAPLLGAGSLLRAGRRWAAPAVLIWFGLAVGVAVAEPLTRPVR